MGWISSLAVLVLAVSSSDAKSNLTGVVTEEDGKPVAGATVYIYTAGVRNGYSAFCPSCYADCGKRSTTDAQGHFEIKGLDPELLFRVLTIADDYEPKFEKKVDPGKGDLTITLAPRRELPSNPQRWLKGRVVDLEGKPIAGAVVEPIGRKTPDGGQMWGEMPNIDPMAISNQLGEFVITSREDVEALDLEIHARGMVTRTFELVETGKPPIDLQLYPGSFLKGRLVKDGKPMPGIAMGLVQKDRSIPNFVGNYTIATDEQGNFLFSNVVTGQMMYVYGMMDSLKSLGSVAGVACLTGNNGQTTNVGDLEIRSGYTINGKVILSDGKAIPEGIRVNILRDRAWDSQTLELRKDGTFHVEGIPPEPIGVNVAIPGYRISPKNASFEVMNGFSIKGLVDRDIDNLTILLEPGKPVRPDFLKMTQQDHQKLFKDASLLETQPLQGIIAVP